MDNIDDVEIVLKDENGNTFEVEPYEIVTDTDAICDERLEQMSHEIEEIDTFIQQLKERKASLVKAYNRINEKKMQQKSKALKMKNWEEESFEWSKQIREMLKNTFKLTHFRPLQLQAINAILSKHDVILLASTGAGKSLCYQLPAMYSHGLTLVVSPMTALMQNQIWALQKLGIYAEMLDKQTNGVKNNAILNRMFDRKDHCNVKLLYVTPEQLTKNKRFMAALQKIFFVGQLSMIAIDEVHCCSELGHDYRPDYQCLSTIRTMFPRVPILCVTATATSKVIDDVQKMLNIQDSLVFRATFNRRNLFYHVMEKPSEKEEQYTLVTQLIKNRYKNQAGIIYTLTINEAEDLAKELAQRGVKARSYHARMAVDRMDKVLTNWLSGQIHTVVATTAFGKGIDNPDVRYVIHHTLSNSIENYYQESGRAGRDGKRADCILLYRFGDMSKISTMRFDERTGLQNAYAMIDYCIDGSRCRRDLIAKHFAEVWSDLECNQMCDHCFHRQSVRPPALDLRAYCTSLYTIIDNAAQKDFHLTGAKLIDAWFYKGALINRCPSVAPPIIDRYFAEQIVAHLITTNYLKEDFHFAAVAPISYINRGQLDGSNSTQPIEFECARVLCLPNAATVTLASAASDDNDEVHVQSVSQAQRKIKKKPKVGSRSDGSSTSRHCGGKTDEKPTHDQLLELDDDDDDSEAESMRSVTHQSLIATVLAKEKKRRKLAEQDNSVDVIYVDSN